jgi:hypothetical protein
MVPRVSLPRCIFVLILSIGPLTRARAAQRPTAQRCGVDQRLPAQRIFADPDGKHGWREYRSVKDVPELDNDAGEFALLWTGHDGSILVSTQEPGQDFAAYTDYCFDSSGQLLQLRFQLRTAWGWGYKEDGTIRKGLLVPETSQFFNTGTNVHIAKPEQAADITDALKPRLYLRVSQLPFHRFLTKNQLK